MARGRGALVRALQGETVDALVWRTLGRDSGAVEAVLEANPGLAETETLSEGLEVFIPDTAQAPAARADLIQLWD